MKHECQMTMDFNPRGYWAVYGKCVKPAKFRNPKPSMGVEFVCGIHANSLNKMYERIGDATRCQPIK